MLACFQLPGRWMNEVGSTLLVWMDVMEWINRLVDYFRLRNTANYEVLDAGRNFR